jgi:UDP-glucose 4-epimerase
MYHLDFIEPPGFFRESGLKEQYRGKRVLVLGGDGFIGVHVATALMALGARVSILSRRHTSLLESTGINIFRGHLLQREVLQRAMVNQDMVFDLAGSSGGFSSNKDAHRNLVSECQPHLAAFQCAAELPESPLMVFCSTRTVYGRPKTLPVSEDHPLAPISVYAIHKVTLENYLQVFHQTRGLNYLIFRVGNPYGPYLWQEKKDYGVMNQFILNAHYRQPIRLFGDGEQMRDYIYIDDLVEALLRGAVQQNCRNEIFNLGGPSPISMKSAVEVLVKERPGTQVQYEPWPEDYRKIETGDYFTDSRKLRTFIPNLKQTGFAEGARRTLDVYSQLQDSNIENTNFEVSVALTQVKQDSIPPQPEYWHGKRVMITGVNGFIGGELARRLVGMGAAIMAVTRKPLREDLNGQVYPVLLDLEEENPDLSEIEQFKPEVIFHMASRPDGPEVETHAAHCIDVNLRGTVNLLELARRISVSAFIFADSVKVFGNSPVPHRENSPPDPSSSYAASKLSAWHYCQIFARLHGVKLVGLRPTLVYGPGQKSNLFTFLAKAITSGLKTIPLAGGLQTRDPLYIDDALNAYLRAAEMAYRLGGRALPLGGGVERPVKEIAAMFLEAAGYDGEIECRKEDVRPTEMMRSYCDNVDVWEALHWRPETELALGLRKTAEFLLGKEFGRKSASELTNVGS